MSALAAILLSRGHRVSGSDLTGNPQMDELKKLGARVHIGHDKKNLARGVQRVIINGAIADDNPELVEAQRRGLEIVRREDLLAEIARGYKNVIAIAGTHGKSTTTAMVAAIFRYAALNPTVHNGATGLDGGMGQLHQGGDNFFITEACEFKKGFLALTPTVTVITNIDADHMDCYRDMDDVRDTYQQLAGKSRHVVINRDCPNSKTIMHTSKSAFGCTRCHRVTRLPNGHHRFFSEGLAITLPIIGIHNVYNALAAIAVARHFRISTYTCKKALESFGGIARRFEHVGKIGEVNVISDYAHHPTELRTTIDSTNGLYRRILYVFQPHTYSRTKAHFAEFVDVLGSVRGAKMSCGGADEFVRDVVLLKTYSAREKPIRDGSAKDLAEYMGLRYFETHASLRRFVIGVADNYDAVVFMGAGDVDAIPRSINIQRAHGPSGGSTRLSNQSPHHRKLGRLHQR